MYLLLFWTKGIYNSYQMKYVSHSPVHTVERILSYMTESIFMFFLVYRNPTFTIKQEDKQKCASCWKSCLYALSLPFNANNCSAENWVWFQFHLKTQKTWFMVLLAWCKITILPGILFLNFWPTENLSSTVISKPG